jgi:hypothetical protein
VVVDSAAFELPHPASTAASSKRGSTRATQAT